MTNNRRTTISAKPTHRPTPPPLMYNQPVNRWPTPSSIALWHRSSTSRHSSLKFVLQCSIWYASSAMSSNTGKSIMNHFRYPVTLTFVQFFFVASYCAIFMSPLVGFSRLRPPTRAIFNATLPMGAFQVGGHIFSSMAISRIPVSTVHTIKVRTFLSHPDLPLIFPLGIVSLVHCRRIRLPLQRQLLPQDLHFPPTPHYRRHARMHL